MVISTGQFSSYHRKVPISLLFEIIKSVGARRLRTGGDKTAQLTFTARCQPEKTRPGCNQEQAAGGAMLFVSRMKFQSSDEKPERKPEMNPIGAAKLILSSRELE